MRIALLDTADQRILREMDADELPPPLAESKCMQWYRLIDERPTCDAETQRVEDGGISVDGDQRTITRVYTVVELPPPPPPTEADYIVALEAHYDAKAKDRRYDNRLTCALRAGYAGPFQAEGAAFAVWMDTCNALAYQIMGAVLAGTRAQPTIDELIAELPALEWPA